MTNKFDHIATLRSDVPLCGAASCGKTALVCQFASNGKDFPKQYRMTVGVELSVASVKLPEANVLVKLQLLDCGGHEAQVSIVEEALGDTVFFCCFVYSVTDRASFDAVTEWHGRLQRLTADTGACLRGVLTATKCDLASQRHEVTAAEGQGLASDLGLEFVQASATSFAEACKPFHAISRIVQQAYDEHIKHADMMFRE